MQGGLYTGSTCIGRSNDIIQVHAEYSMALYEPLSPPHFYFFVIRPAPPTSTPYLLLYNMLVAVISTIDHNHPSHVLLRSPLPPDNHHDAQERIILAQTPHHKHRRDDFIETKRR